jgi:hypothetical protein
MSLASLAIDLGGLGSREEALTTIEEAITIRRATLDLARHRAVSPS